MAHRQAPVLRFVDARWVVAVVQVELVVPEPGHDPKLRTLRAAEGKPPHEPEPKILLRRIDGLAELLVRRVRVFLGGDLFAEVVPVRAEHQGVPVVEVEASVYPPSASVEERSRERHEAQAEVGEGRRIVGPVVITGVVDVAGLVVLQLGGHVRAEVAEDGDVAVQVDLDRLVAFGRRVASAPPPAPPAALAFLSLIRVEVEGVLWILLFFLFLLLFLFFARIGV